MVDGTARTFCLTFAVSLRVSKQLTTLAKHWFRVEFANMDQQTIVFYELGENTALESDLDGVGQHSSIVRAQLREPFGFDDCARC